MSCASCIRFLIIFLGVIDSESKNEQVLDKLQVERERGITVKAQTASLLYDYKGETYLLNLIDTPVSLIVLLKIKKKIGISVFRNI